MATGAGKTYTATTWLTREVVNGGGRVLWLAHSDELLEQATVAFHRAAALATDRDRLAVRIVSARHHHASQVHPSDDIIVASVASLAHRPGVLTGLLDDPGTFIVIDEAHHAPAGSYRAILGLQRAGGRRLLGLTATPTRTIVRERPVLSELFGNRVLYEADAADLVERGILARPHYVHVDTRANVDRDLSSRELAALTNGAEFDQTWLNRVARMERRNDVVVDHYLKHRGQYGKTLVFAITIEQAVLLSRRLRDAGVSCDYVASRRSDHRSNREVLRQFQDPAGNLGVLVNVQVLTEGVDLPSVQTVILARPTTSPILACQMAGRALRGPAVGGTAVAYIVALRDDWRQLSGWQAAPDLVPGVESLLAVPAVEAGVPRSSTSPARPPIETVAAEIQAMVSGNPTDSTESAPDGWYVLTPVGVNSQVRSLVAIYTHQRACWEAAVDYLERLSAEDLAAIDTTILVKQYFGSCEPPLPPARAFDQLLGHFRGGSGRPLPFGPECRLACDPRSLARQIVEDDLGERDRSMLLEKRYTALAQAIYPTLRDYRAAVDREVFALQHPYDTSWIDPSASGFAWRAVETQERDHDGLA